MSLLRVENLSVQYRSRRHAFSALKNISFILSPQEVLGVVGESGAGKSTFGKAILGILEKGGVVTDGKIELQDEALDVSNEKFMAGIRGKRISMVFQDPMTALNPLLTIRDQLLDTILRHQDLSRREAETCAADYLREMDFAEPTRYLRRYPHQLSGGQRQRVVIALALCSNPQVIIADEPVTALDVSVQSMILALFRKVIAKHRVGVILITHDIGVVREVSDKMMVMYKGEVVEFGDTASVLKNPRHPYSQSLIAAIPSIHKTVKRFVNINFIENASATGHDSVPAWLLSDDQSNRETERSEQPALEVKNVGKLFLQKRGALASKRIYFQALKNISFTVRRGQTMGVVGGSRVPANQP